MDSNLVVAIVTSVATAASTSGVAITALLLSNKRIDRVEKALDDINVTLGLINGNLHEIDKRLGVVEDRIFNR